MDAFIEIIAKLVESVPSQTWKEQSHFPFQFLENPQSKVYDVCLFETNAQGAYGFLWIEFVGVEDLLIFPFSLARYMEDGDLISLPPWSLRNATSDNAFYEAWRKAHKQRNPIVTARKGLLSHKKQSGDPGFVAMNIWSDVRNTCVRIDYQVTYKMFRTLEKKYPLSIEVEFLNYLGSQSVFTNFAKLTSVFEYSGKDFYKSHVAIGMNYVQNNGVLFPHFVSLLQRARFPKQFKERSSQQAWDDILKMTESLGRLLGDFHKAMSLAPRNSELCPEFFSKVKNEKWFEVVSLKMDERLNLVMMLQKFNPNFSGVFYLLPDFVSRIKESVSQLDDIGLRIRNHGDLHLGQILLGRHEPVLLDYDSDNFDEHAYRRLKQPCLKDFASLVISIRFAWHFTERKYYADLAEQKDKLELYPQQNKTKVNAIKWDKNAPSLQELETILTKFYKNSLDENMTSLHLRPKNPAKEKVLFNFCFLMRILKEIARESPEGNPRTKLWLHILQDFIMQENTV